MKHPIIRTIYLHLFALVGLALLAIGAYRFIDLGLKIWVFTGAEQETMFYVKPISIGYDPEYASMKSIQNCETKCELNEAQIEAVNSWMKDYDEWKKKQDAQGDIDYRSQNRQRTASEAIALLLVGLPLYLYHWRLIKKDIKNKEE